MSDYVQEGDVGFKKPKVGNTVLKSPTFILTAFSAQTKKKRATRRQPEAELIDASGPGPSTSKSANEMEVDIKPVIPNMDANFVDDDDLQAVLAQARRRKLAKPKIISSEEIAERRKYTSTLSP